jgi:predicted aspartyl protease
VRATRARKNSFVPERSAGFHVEEVIFMGRIMASVAINNVLDPDKRIRCDTLVDTGASLLVLPSAWRDRLGDLPEIRQLDLETATQDTVKAIVCAPIRLQIEQFPPVVTEVAFVEMTPRNGEYEALLGYIPLEQSQAAVDMLGHRLVYVKRLDLK